LALVAGAASVSLATPAQNGLAKLAPLVPRCVATGEVLEARSGLGTFGSVETISCDGRAAPPGVVVFEGGQAFPGSPFTIEGFLVPLGRSDFDRARERAGAVAAITGRAETGRPPGAFRSLAFSLRNSLVDAAAELPAREGALLAGLTIGDTSRVAPADEQAYRDSGLAHLVAVSGSNIAIVAGAVLLLLTRAALYVRLLAAALTLFVYVTIVGPDASVLRAAAMGLFALLALAAGRRHEALSALAYALAALLLVRPEMIHSLGLQLSAAATAGLALWSGPLAARLGRLPSVVGFTMAATVAAQFAVAPLLIHHFGALSLVGVLANLLALPAVGPATVLGLAGGVAGAVWEPLGDLCAQAALPFVWWIVRVADVAAAPGWAAVEVPPVVGLVLAPVAGAAAVYALRRSA
jgi:competence protein ComEC